ncbi:L-tyrosine/L-tryptophan isonitrile synthase family protein [Rugamonas sp. CCM 8940]|uniref:isocyanide synthase family protein n=1 Tax=Rugamonas sp. CCM 8940 TaxID=2765359 RepID=UPI0018F7BC33|nr:isocyanide synthase family protein [Rugamonas sp. CCM 8940]MBJ7309592.1 isocyanide synthase family protein [Rugamonas sp. CCM 8940]
MNQRLPNISDPALLVRETLAIILEQRRLSEGHAQCALAPCAECYCAHLDKATAFIAQNQPLHFILPAFPAKSPNLSKVLGPLPDLGEHLSLRYLNQLCARIAEVYPPGARITICSDGRVFTDCVGVSDDDVSRYGRRIKAMLAANDCQHIDVFNLEDHFQQGDFDAIRRQLIAEHGRSVDELKEELKHDANAKHMFNGIHRFMFTDLKARRPDSSNTKLREEAKELAYQVIIHSNAWSGLVEGLFPAALRLSIHPQHPHSRKIGVALMACDDIWRTPWHGAVLDDGNSYRLMSREDIEKMPVDLVYENGQPIYYVLRRYQHEQNDAIATVAA